MPRPASLAWTPSAEQLWSGEVPETFRQEADEILGTLLPDPAWDGLRRCIRIYAMLLNHEYAAAPLNDQVKALRRVSAAAQELIAAIGAADSEAHGQAVSYQVQEAWEKLYDHGAEFDRDVGIMADDLQQVMSEDDAWSLIAGWRAAHRIVRPEPVADFVVRLNEFGAAARLAVVGLEKGSAPKNASGGAFQEFIGRLYEWRDQFRYDFGVSNSLADGGRLTQLVKAVIAQVPEIKDTHGQLARKQMRRAHIADTSLADAISTAQKSYEANRPQGK